jgi:hypothetical protein
MRLALRLVLRKNRPACGVRFGLLMFWIQGAFIHTCTGGPLADTDGSSQIPYFLTASQCLSKNNVAGTLLERDDQRSACELLQGLRPVPRCFAVQPRAQDVRQRDRRRLRRRNEPLKSHKLGHTFKLKYR